MLVSDLVNVRYLTGFTGSNGAVLIGRDGSTTLAVDGRYEEQAAAEASDVDLLITRSVVDLVRKAAKSGPSLGIEARRVTLDLHDRMSQVAGVRLVPTSDVVESLRLVKDDAELDLLAAACRITSDSFDGVISQLAPGMTEHELSWKLTLAMRDREAEEPAFPNIVAFGPNSAIPHHQPTDRPLALGDLVKLDFGARVGGYHADMTRTVVCGRAADWQRDLHDLVREVQSTCCEAVAPGALPRQLDKMARDAITSAGHDFVHGLGHGVGLEIHESPFLSPETTAARLVERVPVTVEPGVYLPGRGGVRIEDTVVVRAGGAQCLTAARRELIEI
jgi:Xaa-Pro aminopeptidase